MEELNINNYIFDKPLTNDNSGFSRWGFGMRGGAVYFVKEFLSPAYPVDDADFNAIQLEDKIKICKEFEDDKLKLYQAINEASDGNIVRIRQFFRVKAKYYIVTEAVQESTLSIEEISNLSIQERLTICCIAAHAVAKLHQKHIVHADIKPDNVLVTKNEGLKAKIIDFDCSFFEDNSPEPGEELNGDLVYLSPEAFFHMAEIESELSCKMDIFALGILFHQYLTGQLPLIDTDDYAYTYEAVLDESHIGISLEIADSIRSMLLAMLDRKPEKRPDANIVFETLKKELMKLTGRTVTDEADRSEPKPIDQAVETYFSTAGDL